MRGALISVVDWYVGNDMGLVGTSGGVSICIRELDILACNFDQIYWHEDWIFDGMCRGNCKLSDDMKV